MAKATPSKAPVSLSPEDAIAGGGLFTGRAKVEGAQFVEYDYNGKVDPPVCALQLTLETESGESLEQYWSMGTLGDEDTEPPRKGLRPSSDGSTVDAVEGAAIRNNCRAYDLFQSFSNAGMPNEVLAAGDCSAFVGIDANWIRKTVPKLESDISKYDRTVLIVDQIHAAPWDKGKGKRPAGKPMGRPATAAVAKPATTETTNSFEETAAETIVALLASKPSYRKDQLVTAAYTHLLGNKAIPKADRNQVLDLIQDDEFLNTAEGFEFDGKVVSRA